ncbi:thioredoxin-like protein, putative [Bodo saltans]|uniref:Thioredoxin-like protein, putative n=1 Tax=Bodo saltans TaxID=75058 RepID=A0A0S4ISI9_BODSA|nr:thioredoxin-like protein, putative [Bodo saltans]|eukprot:CUF59710.1 thioredoxin-like protein, putative [Bodo saltans]
MSIRAIVSLAEFSSIIRQPKLTVVDFHAVWCGPCKAIAPHLQRMADEKKNSTFLKVDVDQAQEIAAEYRIRAMPTFLLFKNGQKVDSLEGADIQTLQRLVQQHEVATVAPIPSDEELATLSNKQLFTLCKEHHINAEGILEKSELLDAIKKHR